MPTAFLILYFSFYPLCLFLFYRSITRNDLVNYVKGYYRPSRMVLAGAGGVNHEALVKTAEQLFGKMRGDDACIPEAPTHCRYTGTFRFIDCERS